MPADNDNVRIFVRPEDVTVADGPGSGANVVAARVVSHIHQGTHTVTRVETASLGPIEMRIGGGQIIDRNPAGSAVDIRVSRDNAIILEDAEGAARVRRSAVYRPASPCARGGAFDLRGCRSTDPLARRVDSRSVRSAKQSLM